MSLLGHDNRTVKSWKAAPKEMSLEATAKDGQVTVLTWRAAEDCSRYEDRRPEKLGHRRSTAAHGGQSQSVTMPRRNADDIELRCLLAVCVSAWQPKTPRLTVMEQSATRDSGLLLTFTFRRETKSHLFASHTAELALSALMVSR